MCISTKKALTNILPVLILNIGLPTLDVFSDVLLICTLYQSGHLLYASALLTPLLLNFLFTSFSWWTLETRNEQRWTWILLLCQIWPQYRAFQIIVKIYKDDPNFEEEQKNLERDVGMLEPFLESVPSALIMTILLAKVYESKDNWDAIFNEGGLGAAKLLFSYALSVFSASFAVTKFLKVGPCRIFPEGGPCIGLCTARFLTAFNAVALTMVGKGCIVASHIHISTIISRQHTDHLPTSAPQIIVSFVFYSVLY